MGFHPPRRPLALAVAAGLGTAALSALSLLSPAALQPPARAQGTPGLLEFRWENSRDYRKLYFFMTNTQRLQRSEYYLVLRPKDRKTAILKLSVTIPDHFDAKIDPSRVELCRMSKGGMLSRTRCLETIPATIEIAENGGAIEIFPDTPVSDTDTIGVYMRLFNPFDVGMYQFNALAQAPGEVPISGYLGSWLIQIDPPSN
ncbi:DUF2808 domain-containing protein [Cyanobium sp. NS01]|jgi:hypothetical protein|uniref:DUF2808 domain-containing protein n=1 Tax=Cyanobium sp. NS01 TaxID=261284 RepID=UPI001646E4D9|nr:DUF2808 domain-containing protein [Cyanobium sp. NS01]QNI71362.1 uncharacterized conserved lipoprotein (DUF2808) [Cyanobium sp. NS01]